MLADDRRIHTSVPTEYKKKHHVNLKFNNTYDNDSQRHERGVNNTLYQRSGSPFDADNFNFNNNLKM